MVPLDMVVSEIRIASRLSKCLRDIVYTAAMFPAMMAGLNDYTNDPQLGDTGSLVRSKAVYAADLALSKYNAVIGPLHSDHMVMRICALATEHMDNVRYQAALCLQKNWQAFGLGQFPPL